MKFWLIKSEPSTWSWQDQKEHKVTAWDGVRNYQAANNLRTMRIGDLCFFYHSVIGKKIMGVVRVIREYYPDISDETGRFGMVDVAYHQSLERPVGLSVIKSNPCLQHLALIKQSRLSVMPVDETSWQLILSLSHAD